MIRFLGLFRRLDGYHANLVIGQRGAGKSCILARIAERKIEQGYTVYSNYPIRGTYQIPFVSIKDKRTGLERTYLDKDFLYSLPEDCVIIIDECSTVWNNRAYGKWTEDDSEFFNFLRKKKQYLYLACQYYDTVDLNVRRALEMVIYLSNTSIFPNVSHVSLDYQSLVKVEDVTKVVLDKHMYVVNYMPCVLDLGTYRMRRKPAYGLFDTFYKPFETPVKPTPPTWDKAYFESLGSLDNGETPLVARLWRLLFARIQSARNRIRGSGGRIAPQDQPLADKPSTDGRDDVAPSCDGRKGEV